VSYGESRSIVGKQRQTRGGREEGRQELESNSLLRFSRKRWATQRRQHSAIPNTPQIALSPGADPPSTFLTLPTSLPPLLPLLILLLLPYPSPFLLLVLPPLPPLPSPSLSHTHTLPLPTILPSTTNVTCPLTQPCLTSFSLPLLLSRTYTTLITMLDPPTDTSVVPRFSTIPLAPSPITKSHLIRTRTTRTQINHPLLFRRMSILRSLLRLGRLSRCVMTNYSIRVRILHVVNLLRFVLLIMVLRTLLTSFVRVMPIGRGSRAWSMSMLFSLFPLRLHY